MYNDSFLQSKLNQRSLHNALRSLQLPTAMVDFCSNDYLGIVKNNLLHHTINHYASGSTGSRLLAGNYTLIENTEKLIANFHDAAAGLLFNSGYDANVGLLSCVPQRGDTVLYDYLCHASIRDGIRLSLAQAHAFKHNDLYDLEQKLQHSKCNVFVVTESVFSMDGDMAPLTELVALCQKYQAHIIVDEAHATGVIGKKGEGLVQHVGLQEQVFARVHTFGKACGCHGAIVLGSDVLKQYLINFARSFIYTTALPEASVQVIKNSYSIFPFLEKERQHIQNLVEQFQKATINYATLPSTTPIQIVLIPSNENVKKVAQQLQQHNFDVRAILYPTVPLNQERLRIVLHAFNTAEEVNKLCALLGK